jgi:hypothetical protein
VSTQLAASPTEAELREVVEELAPIERGSASSGERAAAEWIAEHLAALGCSTSIDEELVRPDPWRNLTALCAVATAAGLAGARGWRTVPALAALAAGVAMADDVQNGAHLARRATVPERPTWTVVAETGDRAADRTAVVLAHHDAAHTGVIFNPAPQREVWRRWPHLIERTDTAVPLWWPVLAGPAIAALGSLTGRGGLARTGAAMSTLSAAAFVDIGRRPVVQGANDNLSGVACLAAVARALRDEPVEGVRVLLVSCGSEETLQEGIRAFGRRRFGSLPTDSTWFVNVDTVGSPELILLEGEGPVWMEDYDDGLRELTADCARAAGVHLRRGLRARTSTDGVIPMRAGYPTVTLASVEPWKAPSNYHWPTDTPDRLDYSTVADAARLTEAVVRRLGGVGPARTG